MAEHDDTIDLTTLQEVQRLLSSTEFASAGDLVRHGAVPAASPRQERPRPLSTPPADLDPLPRRR